MKSEFFINFLNERPLQHDRANGRMGLVTSFQAFARVASVVVLMGLVFAASRILSKERLFKIKKLVESYLLIMSSSDARSDSSLDSETAGTEVEYDLEVEVMPNASKQNDTSDDDEPEDVYANAPLADENWLSLLL